MVRTYFVSSVPLCPILDLFWNANDLRVLLWQSQETMLSWSLRANWAEKGVSCGEELLIHLPV